MGEMMGEMKSIKDFQKMRAGELIEMYLRSGWVFESVWEKLILVALGILGMWKIVGWIW